MSIASHLVDVDWMTKAACRGLDSDLFFPVDRGGGAPRYTSRAKAICARCAVLDDCLDYALGFTARDDVGIFAGTNATERRELRRMRP